MRPDSTPHLQSAALPWRRDAKGRISVLVVTTRRSRRWSIPKGNAAAHLSLAETAAKEAFEEAGVAGTISPLPAAVFRTTKRAAPGTALLEVWVFLLEVTGRAKRWPERGERDGKWVTAKRAAKLLAEPALADLCRRLAERRAAG